MVKHCLLAVVITGCGIRALGAHDATLPYHPPLDELRSAPDVLAPTQVGAPRAVNAQVIVDGFAEGYPEPIGLAYNSDGAFRKVIAVEWGDHALASSLADGVRVSLVGGAGQAVHIAGGVVELAHYRFGSKVYVHAMLELRASRSGFEVYSARYQAQVRGECAALRDRRCEGAAASAVARELVEQIRTDDRLLAAVEGGAR